MKIDIEFTDEDYIKAYNEIKQYRETGVLCDGVVRRLSSELKHLTNNIDYAVKLIYISAFDKYVKTLKQNY